MNSQRLYARNWRVRVKARLLLVGHRCEQCGIVHRSIAHNQRGEPYMVYLQGCHLAHDPWNPDAEFRIWCPACHNRYDAAHRTQTRHTALRLR